MTYGLIGCPLGHSFSQKYFTEKFTAEHIDAVYQNFEIKEIGMIHEIIKNHPDLQGFNVTIPHKQNIIPLLDHINEEARQIGAVNCVKIDRNDDKYSLTGYNTDAYGFKNALLQLIPHNLTGAIILGNGGAAKAVRYVLNNLGMNVLTASRTPQHASEIGYPEISGYLPDFKLFVNTTPLGTWPRIEECPDIPYIKLTPEHYLFDLVYNPATTTFMQKGIAAGAQVSNGLNMLIGQAEKAWEIWNR